MVQNKEKLGPLLRKRLEEQDGDPRVLVRLRDNVAVSNSSVSILSNTGADVVREERDLGFVVMDALPGEIDRLQEQRIVEEVELDAQVRALQGENPFSAAGSGAIPALDASAASTKVTPRQVHEAVNAVRPQNNGFTGQGVTVAVVDTGVDSTHPALTGKVSSKVKLASGNIEDGVGHGTWVASSVAGNGASVNGTEVLGVAPDADIINVKVLDSQGTGRISDVLTGLQRAANNGADIINMSLGIPNNQGPSATICSVISDIVQQNSVTVIGAAGNRGPSTSPHLPAQCPETLAVGSTDLQGNVSTFSSRGPVTGDNTTITYPDISAPGGAADQGVLGASSGGGTLSLKGTSMASPVIAGAAAILKQENPGATPEQVRTALTLSGSNPEKNNSTGKGLLDVQRALEQLRTGNGGGQTQPDEALPAGAAVPAVIAGGLALSSLEGLGLGL